MAGLTEYYIRYVTQAYVESPYIRATLDMKRNIFMSEKTFFDDRGSSIGAALGEDTVEELLRDHWDEFVYNMLEQIFLYGLFTYTIEEEYVCGRKLTVPVIIDIATGSRRTLKQHDLDDPALFGRSTDCITTKTIVIWPPDRFTEKPDSDVMRAAPCHYRGIHMFESAVQLALNSTCPVVFEIDQSKATEKKLSSEAIKFPYQRGYAAHPTEIDPLSDMGKKHSDRMQIALTAADEATAMHVKDEAEKLKRLLQELDDLRKKQNRTDAENDRMKVLESTNHTERDSISNTVRNLKNLEKDHRNAQLDIYGARANAAYPHISSAKERLELFRQYNLAANRMVSNINELSERADLPRDPWGHFHYSDDMEKDWYTRKAVRVQDLTSRESTIVNAPLGSHRSDNVQIETLCRSQIMSAFGLGVFGTWSATKSTSDTGSEFMQHLQLSSLRTTLAMINSALARVSSACFASQTASAKLVRITYSKDAQEARAAAKVRGPIIQLKEPQIFSFEYWQEQTAPKFQELKAMDKFGMVDLERDKVDIERKKVEQGIEEKKKKEEEKTKKRKRE